MRLILARLLFAFDIELDKSSDDWTKEQKSWVTWFNPPLNVRLTPVH